VVLVEKGPLPNPGGSTGHASNFIFPIEYSKMMMELTADSTEQYKSLGVHVTSGGIEVARRPERLEELRRRASACLSWGIDCDLLDPAGVQKLVPFLDPDVILAGLYFPGVGVVDSLRAGTIMRERAVETGALTVHASTEVLGIDLDGPAGDEGPSARGRVPRGRAAGGERGVRAVRTTAGVIETDCVAICCGVWSPRIAEMAGARIALTPIVHQMISVGPIPAFADTVGEISYPIVRDVDTNMYERQHGGDMEVGSYAHRPILVRPEAILSNEEAALSPTELPFTKEDFDPQLEEALELMPELLGDETVGIRYAINGLISMTPDGHPVLGELPGVKGLWSVAASWIKEGPGIGRAVAEQMTSGRSEIDIHEAAAARFYEFQLTRGHVEARASEGFNKMYGIVHPEEQWSDERRIRLSPMYDREVELGAHFFSTAGWERPHWYEHNTPLVDRYGDKVMPREAEWESRWWSPVINAEHLAMRDAVGIVDLSAFAVFDVTGPGALEAMQRLAVAQMDVAGGRVVYTSFLDDAGGFRADLTVMRLGTDHFRVVTGGGVGMSDKTWIVDHLPADGSAQLADVTSAWATIGIWGPKARAVLGRATPDDVSNEGFKFATCRQIEVGGVRVLASRISYVGELGWECYIPMEQALRVWDALYEAGEPDGIVPVGIGVYATTGRLEKCYRAFGNELTADYDLVEAGMGRPSVKPQDFVGKEAYLAQREREPAALLCTLTLDEPRAPDGRLRYPLGGEPVLTLEGERIVDAKGRPSYITSAGSGPSVGRHLMLAYLPAELAEEGRELLVEYMSERHRTSVAVSGSRPIFDPANERVRA
ncbi:MAG: GcvT family protein, partial [Acidimicrobiales bacterium]